MAQLQLPGLEGGGPSFLQGLVGNSTVETIFTWQVAAQLLNALLQPFMNQLAQLVNHAHPTAVLSPADAADMQLRGWMTHEQAQAEAEASGINNDRFDLLANNAGEPPGIMQILEMYRRGIIPFDGPEGTPSVTYGIKTSRVRDEWIPALNQLRYAVPTPGDVVDAWVENQVDAATAQKLLSEAGIAPDYHQLLHDTRGRPPGPGQLADMVHRGIIPETGTGPEATTFQQGISESAVKDKWTDPLFRLSAYLPPPRTVTAMIREGVLTQDQAARYLQMHGLSPELAAAYVAGATAQKLAPHKALAESVVTRLYADKAIGAGEATDLLGQLGFDPHEASFILEVTDLAETEKYVNGAIGKVRTLYDADRLDKAHASAALDSLGVAPGQRDKLLALWDTERQNTVRILTEAQVVGALYYKVIDQKTAQAKLEALGYSPYDAWVLIGVRMHGPQGSPPAVEDFPSGNIT